MTDLLTYLKERPYPGRGILLGATPGGKAVCAYFIMGRSENSRNRVFEKTDDGIRTRAWDESKMTDPSLIIYHPVRRMADGTLIVTNGDQTDTVRDFLAQDKGWLEALCSRTFEPDEPNWTPRVSGLIKPCGSHLLSILKAQGGNPDCCERFFYTYDAATPGVGHFISTYKHNGNPIPSFEGEPLRFACPRTIGDFAHGLWENLNPDNKVSLFARVIDLDSGETGDMIFNKYDAVNSDLDDPEEPELLPEELELLAKLDAEAE